MPASLPFTIQTAKPQDHELLTEIAFAAKKHWNYPEHYFDIWKNELTISKNYVLKNIVFKTILNLETIGFYSIVFNPNDYYSGDVFVQKGFWLEHIFILPQYHGKGIGTTMINHAKKTVKQKGAKQLLIFVDPLAEGFYKAIGAEFIQYSNSSIPERKLPVYALKTVE